MPKPVRKATKKSTTPKRPSSDPNRRAKQMMDEHMAKAATSQPPWAKDVADGRLEVIQAPESFAEQFRVHMAKLGSKGGKVSGAKRMEMPAKQRKAIAKKAADARWGKTGK